MGVNNAVNPPNSLESELYSSAIVAGNGEEIRLLRNMILAVRRNLWIIALASILAAAGTFFWTSSMEDGFTATSRVKLNTRTTTDVQYTPGGATGLPITIASIESELEVLRSSDLVEQSVLELGLLERPADTNDVEAMEAFQAELDALVVNIRDRREIEQLGATSAVFEIRVTDPNPYLASQLANAIARQYLERQRLDKIRSLERAQGWLSERTLQLQSQITQLVNQQEAHTIESPFSEEEYATIKAQRQIAERQLLSRSMELEQLQARLAEVELFKDNGRYEEAAELVSAGNPRLTTAITSMAEIDPELNPVEASALQEVVSAELQEEIARKQQELAFLSERVGAAQDTVEGFRQNQEMQAIHDSETRRIENEIIVTQAIYQDFVSQLSRRTEQSDFLDSDGQIIEFARPPASPSLPNERALTVVAFSVTALIGLLAAAISGMIQRKLRTTWEYEEASGLPLQGVLPEIGRNKNLAAEMLSGDVGYKFPAMAAFSRKLCASVVAAQNQGKSLVEGSPLFRHRRLQKTQNASPAASQRSSARILAGACSTQGEGQSTALLAMAQAFAEAGEQVLIIDGNFADSAFAAHFQGKSEPFEEIEWGGSSGLYETGVPGLTVLPAFGGRSRAEVVDHMGFFNSKECGEVLMELAPRFDRIIIDSPPLLDTLGAVSLLGWADQVVFFSRWNSTRRTLVRNSMRLMQDVAIKPTFAVATFVRLKELARYGDTSLSHVNFAT